MHDRLLIGHFLQRFLDNDLISPNADRHETLAVLGAAVITGGLFLTVLLSLKYLVQPFASPGRTAIAALDDHFLYIGGSMVAMALLAVVTWDALVIDERDTSILGPLPVPWAAVFRAKLAAVAVFGVGFDLALNAIPTLLHPLLMVAKLPIGVSGAITLTVVHGSVTAAAGAFGFLSVLGLRELLHAVLGQVLFRRYSTLVQGVLVVLLSTAFLLLPGLSSGVARSWLASGRLAHYAVPPLWFLGLQEAFAGESIDGLPRGLLPPSILNLENEATLLYRGYRLVFEELGMIAMLGLATAAFVALAAYAWNGRRAPVGVFARRNARRPAAGLWMWVVSTLIVRRPLPQAGFFFTLQSLSRSMPHRLALAASIAVGLAAATVINRTLDITRAMDVGSVPVSFLAVQSILVTALLAGFRHAVRVPASLRANWAFHLAWPGDERPYFVGVKRAVLVGLVLPLLIALLPVHLWALGWRVGLEHLVCGLLLALVLAEVLLIGFARVPFASSYAPTGNLKALGPAYLVVFILTVYGFASIERVALGSMRGMTIVAAASVALWLAARMIDRRRRRDLATFELEEVASEVTQRLELSG